MTASSGTRWVLCDGAGSPSAPADALHLVIGKSEGRGAITVDIEGIEEVMTGRLPNVFHDLIRIAAFVLAADQATSRGTLKATDMGKTWRRSFRFVIPVHDPDFWQQPKLRRALVTTLDFLSDDHYRFDFVAAKKKQIPRQLHFIAPEKKTFIPWDHVNDVLLFSGGMDSFGGAAEEILKHGRQVILVSHRSSTKLLNTQRHLVETLQRLNGRPGPWHVEVMVTKHHDELRVDQTQRSRSFLFAAIAGAVAHLAGCRAIRFYENGIIALNLPIAPQVVGARASRTAHPKVLAGFGEILGLVEGQHVVVDNPYQMFTRAEVAGRIRDAGLKDLIKDTRSCAHVRGSTTMYPHCGVCSQCLDRRFAIHAAGLQDIEPSEMYEVELFAGIRKADDDQQLALGYVDTARRFAEMQTPEELASSFGEVNDAQEPLSVAWGCTEDEALARVLDLHQRHGSGVVEQLKQALYDRAADLIAGRIPPMSLLLLSIKHGIAKAEHTFGPAPGEIPAQPALPTVAAGVEAFPATAGGIRPAKTRAEEPLVEDTFAQLGDGWIIGFKGTPGKIMKSSRGLDLIAILVEQNGKSFSVLDLEALADGKPRPGSIPGIGPTLDSTAIAELCAEVQRLQADEDEADLCGDESETLRLRARREQIEEMLGAELRPGGKAKEAPPELERARTRVRNAISRSITDLRKQDEALAGYINRHTDKGFDLSFTDPTRRWRVIRSA